MRCAAVALLVLAASVAAADPSLPPRRAPALRRWLADGAWRSVYAPEPTAHASLGAHGGSVRTWYSPILAEDLAAGRTPFRKGAAMVKELLDARDGSLQGYAVMRKVRVRSGAKGRGWWFWETPGSPGLRGRGAPACAGCHARGTDFLLSTFRP